MTIEILKDKDAVASRAAELISAAAAAPISDESATSGHSQTQFTIALAGGSTPKVLYQMLSSPPWTSRLPWDHILWFLGDERFVAPDHPDSNFRMIRETLFDPASVPSAQQFPMQTQLATAEATAEDYAAKLLDNLDSSGNGGYPGVPAFDLVLLGMGDDGHTASLFPNTAALEEAKAPVLANYVEKMKAWRITITPPVLLAAGQRIVMVTGEEKAAALAQVLNGELNVSQYPAQLLRDTHTTWLVDQSAAHLLEGA